MSRRRTMLMNGQEVEEMKKWEELLNESKEVTDQKTVELDLASTESHDEYWLFLEIQKHTGTEQCKGNCHLNLNGAEIGYYALNVDFANFINTSYHIFTEEPLKLFEMSQPVSVSLRSNRINVQRQESVGNETGTGKLVLDFPAKYTGTITARIIGR